MDLSWCNAEYAQLLLCSCDILLQKHSNANAFAVSVICDGGLRSNRAPTPYVLFWEFRKIAKKWLTDRQTSKKIEFLYTFTNKIISQKRAGQAVVSN